MPNPNFIAWIHDQYLEGDSNIRALVDRARRNGTPLVCIETSDAHTLLSFIEAASPDIVQYIQELSGGSVNKGLEKDIHAALENLPGGYWHTAVGSGHNCMTAIYSEDPKQPEQPGTFICDVLPDYVQDDDRAWANRVPLLDFLVKSRMYVGFLLALVGNLRESLKNQQVIIQDQQVRILQLEMRPYDATTGVPAVSGQGAEDVSELSEMDKG